MVMCHASASLMILASGSSTWSTDTSLVAYTTLTFTIFMMSMTLGLVLSLLVERPFMNLAKQVPVFYKLFGDAKAEVEVFGQQA